MTCSHLAVTGLELLAFGLSCGCLGGAIAASVVLRWSYQHEKRLLALLGLGE